MIAQISLRLCTTAVLALRTRRRQIKRMTEMSRVQAFDIKDKYIDQFSVNV